MQSWGFLEPGFLVTVVPGHRKHARLSLSGWNERRSHELQGASPVGENDPGEHGTVEAMKMIINTLNHDTRAYLITY